MAYAKTLEKVNIAGIEIDNITMHQALVRIDELVKSNSHSHIVTPNVDHIVNLQNDSEFKTIYNRAALVLPDGMPLLLAAKFLRTPLFEKVSGSDLFPKICAYAQQKNYRLYFLGGRENAAEKSALILKKKYPEVCICGTYSPPYGFEKNRDKNQEIIEKVKAAKPDILFVGLGSPKQEKWIFQHKQEYQVPVSIGIGISFEYTSGMVKRAPIWMQKFCLEWLWRLLKEPKRLWKRYLINDLGFFKLIIKQKLRKKSRKKNKMHC